MQGEDAVAAAVAPPRLSRSRDRRIRAVAWPLLLALLSVQCDLVVDPPKPGVTIERIDGSTLVLGVGELVGIAKGLWPVGGKLSISGQVVGSPQYMSPERLAGSKNVDVRSDIYSLGIVADQMLTAHLPKYGSRDPRSWRAEIPAPLAQSIERCIQMDPGARWPTVMDAVRATGAA